MGKYMEQTNLLIVLGQWWERRKIQRRSMTNVPHHQYFSGKQWIPTPGNILFSLLVITGLLWAQNAGAIQFSAPSAASTGTIAYQGRLASAGGAPLTQTIDMEFRLYNAATGGAPLWTEQWAGSNSVQVSDGLFNVMMGSLTPIPQSVIVGNSNLFLGITVGTDNEMSPRVQLGNVPFAVQALTVPDGSISKAKLAADISIDPPNGSITSVKLAENLIIYQMTQSVSGVSISGSRPNYNFHINNVEFPQPFPHKTLSVIAWLNVPGTHLGVPIAQPWRWDNNGFAINSLFNCNCDIATAALGYTAVGY